MTRRRAILTGLVGLLGMLTFLAVSARWELGEVPGDYHPFDLAASRFWAGEALYQTGNDPFLSPPPFVFFLLPAHALGLVPGHAFAMCAGLACTVLALWLVRRVTNDRVSIDALFAAGLYVPLWLSAMIGQWGGFFFAVFAATMFFAQQKRPLAAGLCAALLFAKPTFAPFAVAIVALGLGRRAWIGLAIGAIAWLAASLPLGLGTWGAWRAELRYVEGAHAFEGHSWQQHTLYGSFHCLAQETGWNEAALRWVWLAIALPLGLATIALAARALRRGDVVRAFALAALATAALNVYLRYYDSQIVLIPVLVLFSTPKRSLAAGAMALAYVLLASVDAAYFQEQVRVPVEGLLLTGWLVLCLRDAWIIDRTAAPRRPTEERQE